MSGSWVRSIAAGLLIIGGAGLCQAQTPPSRAVVISEVVKLSQAHQSDDVILGYLRNGGATYALTADEIIYLNSQGVSQKVIAALQSSPGPGGPAIAPPGNVPPPGTVPPPGSVPPPGTIPPGSDVPPPGAPDFNAFHSQLAPDGSWVDADGYGPAWRPNILSANPDWRPYYDGGHWAYTDDGWYWQSDYPWGNVVFHYGRWRLSPRYGWVWIPGYNWGPSWVCWRHADGYLGWAPLPPEARFEVGVGLTWRGHVGVDLDFGLGVGLFTFVGYDHFWEHDFRRFVVPHDRAVVIFRGSRLANDYHFDHGRFINEGFGHERVAEWTHHDVRVDHAIARDHGIGFDRGRSFVPSRDGRDSHDSRDDRRDGRDGRP